MEAPFRRIMFAALVAVMSPVAVAGQDAPPSRQAGLEISPFVGVFNDTPEFDPDGSPVFVDPAGNPYFGGYLGYHFGGGLFIEGELGFMAMEMDPVAGTLRDLDLLLYSGSLGYNIPLGDRVQLYPLVGVGQARWSPAGLDSESDLAIHYGGGFRFFLAPSVALRLDARMRQIPTALEATGSAVSGTTPDQTFWGGSATAGISFMLHGGGGGREMEPMDSDGDGVFDDTDACPDTPRGVRVDSTGCPTDSDGDGVFDGRDRCARTPAGARVDVNGCPLDGDRDGVPDGIDRCPDTPSGADVDGRGCPLDSDGDGVFNGIDRCPNTPAGTEVDARGCPVPQRMPEPEPLPTFDNVHFALDSSVLDATAQRLLRQVGQALLDHPDASVQLSGHTDSTASETYNEGLGMRRAQAVRDFLTSNFSGLSASRFRLQSFGETRPVADNGTEAGRRQNRRVEITLTRMD